jgi:N-methylhydantoinase B/oxoprolinase/acetone carboxylase alpha subunit
MIFPWDARVQGPHNEIYADAVSAKLAASARPLTDLGGELAPWLEHGDLAPDPHADPVLQEVINGALSSIWLEMQFTMTRTAYSPVFFEGEDFTVSIFDAELDRVSQREGFPSQMGAMQQAVIAAISHFGWDSISQGDVLVHNSSLVGTPHLPEFCMVRPVFWDGEVIAVVATIAHHADVGGKAAGGMPGDSTDIHQEGVIIPPVKLFRADVADEQIWRIILSNTRTPNASYGDFMAMYGSLVTGERRLHELVARYGVGDLKMYMTELQKYSERRIRAAIREIPNGVYKSTIQADDDGVTTEPYLIALTMLVLDEDVVFDFRGSAPQAQGPINCPYVVTLSACANAMFSVSDYTIPHNQGAFRPFHLIAPAGTIVNCDYPAPLSAGNTESHNLVVEAVVAALRQAVPGKTAAPTGASTGLLTGGGIHPDFNEFYAFVLWEPTGYGAREHEDGFTVTTWVAPQARQFPTEVVETAQPWRVREYSLRADSGGAGRQRGGLGVTRVYEMVSGDQILNSIAHYHRFPALGVHGGGNGLPTEVRIVTVDGVEELAPDRYSGAVSPTKFSDLPVYRGEQVVVRMPGGGGWGPPRDRDRDAVLRDLQNEVISRDAAVEVYGLPASEADATVELYSWERKRRRAGGGRSQGGTEAR